MRNIARFRIRTISKDNENAGTLSIKIWGRILCEKDGAALALRDEMEEIVKEPVLAEQMKDVIEYRAMDYYRRRYKEKIKALL